MTNLTDFPSNLANRALSRLRGLQNQSWIDAFSTSASSLRGGSYSAVSCRLSSTKTKGRRPFYRANERQRHPFRENSPGRTRGNRYTRETTM